MAQTKLNMSLVFAFMAMFWALSSAQAPLPPMGQLPPITASPPVQMPPVGQLPPPVQMPPVGQLPPPTNQAPPVQLPPVGQMPPPTNQAPPAQLPPPVQTPSVQTCNPSSAVTSLAPCVGYLIGNTSSPSTACCSLISSLLSSQSPCLCPMLQTGLGTLGFVFNQTQAISLPSICNMPTNPCTDVSSPTAAPSVPSAVSPSADEPATPVTAQTPAATPPISTLPSGTGVKAVPTTASAAARSYISFAPALLIVLFVASYLSTIGGF